MAPLSSAVYLLMAWLCVCASASSYSVIPGTQSMLVRPVAGDGVHWVGLCTEPPLRGRLGLITCHARRHRDPSLREQHEAKKKRRAERGRERAQGSSGLWKFSEGMLAAALVTLGAREARKWPKVQMVEKLRELNVDVSSIPKLSRGDTDVHGTSKKLRDIEVVPKPDPNDGVEDGFTVDDAMMARAVQEKWLPEGLSYKQAATLVGLQEPILMEEVRAARKQLALRWHPDRNQGNPNAELAFRLAMAACDKFL